MTPVQKKKSATETANYRPVSVLRTSAITFEKVLMPQLSSFLLRHIPYEQFGFIPNSGTNDVGVILADEIAQSLENRIELYCLLLIFVVLLTRCGGEDYSNIYG